MPNQRPRNQSPFMICQLGLPPLGSTARQTSAEPWRRYFLVIRKQSRRPGLLQRSKPGNQQLQQQLGGGLDSLVSRQECSRPAVPPLRRWHYSCLAQGQRFHPEDPMCKVHPQAPTMPGEGNLGGWNIAAIHHVTLVFSGMSFFTLNVAVAAYCLCCRRVSCLKWMSGPRMEMQQIPLFQQTGHTMQGPMGSSNSNPQQTQPAFTVQAASAPTI